MEDRADRTRQAPGQVTPSRPVAARLAVLLMVVLAACGVADETTLERRAGTTTTSTSTSVAPSDTAVATTGFVAFGDFGGGPAQWDVAAAVERWIGEGHRVDALVTTGDNVYDRGEPEHFGAQLDEPYRELRRDRPMWVTLGNHDVIGGHGDEQLRHLGLPSLPYARELPGVQLLFLDGNRPDRVQTQWLEEKLAAESEGRLRVVVLHQPAYSCSLHGPTQRVVEQWVPLFERYRVELALTGHDHNYQRFVSPAGVTYVVTGGGGRKLYPVDDPCELAVPRAAAAARHHFVAVEVTGTEATLTAVASNGEILDRARLGIVAG